MAPESPETLDGCFALLVRKQKPVVLDVLPLASAGFGRYASNPESFGACLSGQQVLFFWCIKVCLVRLRRHDGVMTNARRFVLPVAAKV